MDEKETFFATVALTLGPPPRSHFGMAHSTLVGGKGAPASGRPWQISIFAARMVGLAENTNFPGKPKTESEALGLFVDYDRWYRTQEALREAANAL